MKILAVGDGRSHRRMHDLIINAMTEKVQSASQKTERVVHMNKNMMLIGTLSSDDKPITKEFDGKNYVLTSMTSFELKDDYDKNDVMKSVEYGNQVSRYIPEDTFNKIIENGGYSDYSNAGSTFDCKVYHKFKSKPDITDIAPCMFDTLDDLHEHARTYNFGDSVSARCFVVDADVSLEKSNDFLPANMLDRKSKNGISNFINVDSIKSVDKELAAILNEKGPELYNGYDDIIARENYDPHYKMSEARIKTVYKPPEEKVERTGIELNEVSTELSYDIHN